MKITKYKATNIENLELYKLIEKKYKNFKNFDYFFMDFRKAYNFCVVNQNINFIPIALHENQILVAHIALICDRRLPKGEAFFGFFEAENDLSKFKELWKVLKRKAQKLGLTKLLGPVNGSIWHQYRCITESDGSDFFKSEPISEEYYSYLLSQINPSSQIQYYSASREKFDNVLKKINSKFVKLNKAGFEIKKLKNINPQQLRNIAEISRTVFSKNSWGYTELTEMEFLMLYSTDKLNQHLNKLYLLYKADQIIGFCGTSAENEHTLILKTICILPQFQGLGLGNAMAFKIHVDAQKEGFRKIIYALIREGNQIQNFPKQDTEIFRRYSVFEFKI